MNAALLLFFEDDKEQFLILKTMWNLCVQVSAFYTSSNPPKHLARLCFCKDDSKLEAASQALRKYFLR